MAITLLDMLLQAGMLTPRQLDDALQHRVFFGGKIGTNLVELGYLREEDLAQFLGRKLMVPYISPDRLLHIPTEVIDLIPREMALKYRVIPLELQKKRLSLVMSDPADLAAIDEISFITGFVIKPLIAPELRLMQALGQYYGLVIGERYQKIIDRLNTQSAVGQPAAASPQTLPPKAAPSAPPPVAPPVPTPPPVPAEVAPPAVETPVATSPFVSPPAAGDDLIELLEEADVVEETAWAREVKRYAIDDFSRRLAYVEDRDQIAETLLDSLSRSFGRAALFIVRGDIASGWRAFRGGEEIAGFEMVHIPFARPSVLRTVTEGKSFYLGPLADTPLNQRILTGLGDGKPGSALVMPLVVLGRVVDILYLEGVEGDLADRLPEVQRLLGKAALAFEILICRDKIMMS